MMSKPSLLVVLLNYRTPDMTLRAAHAALADMPDGAEMVIVDNASDDGSLALIESEVAKQGWGKEHRVRVIASASNDGFGSGNNIGIRAGMSDGSAADFIFVVNSDAFADPGCIGNLLAFMLSEPRVGIAGSHVRGEDDLDHVTAFRFPSIAGEFEGAARLGLVSRLLPNAIVAPDLPTETTQVDWVAGASVMLRGEMLREIGLFDETYFLYFEETDLCLRAKRAGWQTWYVPASRVVHIGSATTGMKEWQRMPSYWFESRSYFFKKNYGRVVASGAFVAHVTGACLHRLRCLLKGEPPQDPPHYLRDLIGHAFGRRGTGKPATASAPPMEDRQ